MKTLAEYDAAMAEIERMWDDLPTGGVTNAKFLQLVIETEEFEKRTWPIELTPPPEGGESITQAHWAAYHQENGRLPCGHMSREICSATSCDGVPRLRDPMGADGIDVEKST